MTTVNPSKPFDELDLSTVPLDDIDETPARPRSDVDRALSMFEALGLGDCSDDVLMTVIPGAPWSKARPRFGRGGRTYRAKGDVDAEKRTAAYLRKVCRRPMTGNVAIGAIFFRPNRQRIDADNLLKHVCDAANGVVFADDSQCTAIMGVIEMDPANPRTVVVIGKHRSSMLRGDNATKPCTVCGKPMSLAGSPKRRACSPECATRLRGYVPLSDPVPCSHCGELFRRVSQYRTLCSPECRTASLRAKRKASGTPWSVCLDCGRELTHKRGGRCRDCWRKAHAKTPATETDETGRVGARCRDGLS